MRSEHQLFVEQMIANQQRAIRYYFLTTTCLVILGLIIVAISFLSSAKLVPDDFKGLLGLGGAFVSTLSAFPVKEMLSRKEKVGIYKTLELQVAGSKHKHTAGDEAQRKRAEELIWKVVEKTALGEG